MMLRLSDHAITRYHERVKPALLRRQAKVELEALVAAAGKVGPRPDWLPPEQCPGDGYVELTPGVVAAVVRGQVTTVMVRAGGSPKFKAMKKAARRSSVRGNRGRGRRARKVAYDRNGREEEAA